jgi:PAS domain S-box-containing protein
VPCQPVGALSKTGDIHAVPERENRFLRKKLDQAMLSLRLLEAAKDRYDALYHHAITNLAEALELNQKMLSTAPIGVAAYHADSGRCVRANAAMASILGLSAERLLGQGFWEFPTWQGLLAAARRTLATGQDQHLEVLVNAPSGDSIWIACVLTPFISRAEDHLLVMVNDQTERHHAEVALLASETKYRMLAENLGEGLTMTDPDLHITYFNPGFLRMLGYGEEELRGKPLVDLAFCADQEAFRAMLLDRTQVAAPPHELAVKHRSGSAIDVLVSTTILQNERNEFSGVLCLFTDIRLHKQMDEARRYAQKMESLALMAGSIAHDFNNAFQVILNSLEMIQTGTLDAEQRHSTICCALKSLERAQVLSQNMLDYSGKSFQKSISLDFGRLLVEHQELFERLAGTRVSIAVQERKDGLCILGDPAQLVQAISNLVINAGEALATDGHEAIRITLDVVEAGIAQGPEGFWVLAPPVGPALVMTVCDKGCGVPSEAARKIFDPFFTTKATGRGLGLSAALGILRAHRAGVQVESRLPEGTVFRAVFPLEVARGTPPAPPAPRPAVRPTTRTILLVDDDEIVREVSSEIIQDLLGYSVITAKDGQEAVEMFRRSPDEIALILMDATMPHLSGGEAFDVIKTIRPDAKAILCSGFSETTGSEAILSHGFLAFLKKPYSIKELQAALGKVFEEA